MKAIIAILAGAVVLAPLAAALAQAEPGETFHAAMDKVFGPGGWRETSGYRTAAEEDALRRQGAGTVPPGQISHHSMGSRDQPGAYDVVVSGMSSAAAAARLKASGEPFSRIIAERAHGPQGPHLHIEPGARPAFAGAEAQASDDADTYLRVTAGRRNPLLVRAHHVVVLR